ncbi:hypothetical protein [uncultured Treponema sp.]|uniref:hypothetical protein n=1 Tax=uncultured Treponema sp. TaxID=162155 RepID=UPI0025D7CB62|nr:hypothetical protein [uncultured Treponema sp.]
MIMTQGLLDFSDTLTDMDGDTVVVDRLSDTVRIISLLLKCSGKKAREVLAKLRKDFDVYSNGWTTQLILAKDGRIIHNFELHGETWQYGHKYNPVNDWDFKDFIAGKKMRREKDAAQKPPKPLKITCTEIQLKRAKQLYYAYSVGFDIGYADYKRFYLV